VVEEAGEALKAHRERLTEQQYRRAQIALGFHRDQAQHALNETATRGRWLALEREELSRRKVPSHDFAQVQERIRAERAVRRKGLDGSDGTGSEGPDPAPS
jgi:hypothetical protein